MSTKRNNHPNRHLIHPPDELSRHQGQWATGLAAAYGRVQHPVLSIRTFLASRGTRKKFTTVTVTTKNT